MLQVSEEEAIVRLHDLIDKVIAGESVLIIQDGKQVARLVPVEHEERRPCFGSAKGLITMSDDFNAPLEEFDEYAP